MAAVHLGQMLGGAGFARTVAIKRLHPHVAESPGAVRTFLDEAWLSARVRHPSIVPTLDVVEDEEEILLVFEYVHGAPLAYLEEMAQRQGETMPIPLAIAAILDVLAGLQAVHEATDQQGQPLAIVHRDISPQNVMVGVDGVARVLDFGIAHARSRLQTTENGELKGKLRYMAPEQLQNTAIGSATDIYGASVVLWELLTGKRLFEGPSEGAIVAKVLQGVVIPPSEFCSDVSAELDDIVLRGLSRDSRERFASCREMANALREAATPGSADELGRWVATIAKDLLAQRSARITAIETGQAAPEPPPAEPSFRATMTENQPLDLVGYAPPADTVQFAPPAAGYVTVLETPSVEHSVTGFSAPDFPLTARRPWLTALVAFSVFSVVTVLGLRALVFSPKSAMPPQQEVAEVPREPPVPEARPVETTAPLASAIAAPEVRPTVTAVPTPPRPREAQRPPQPRAVKTPPKPKPEPRANCNPPFRMENGLQIPKSECM
jgi:hypothetical protein